MSVSLRNTTLFTDANLTHYWELENLTDSKGSATLANPTGKSFVPAKFNNGIDMGSSFRNTLELNTSSNVIPSAANAFSISFWFKQNIVLSGSNVSPGLLICSTGAPSGYAVTIIPEWNGGSPRLRVIRRTNVDVSDVVSFVNDTEWHLFVHTYNGTTMTNYIDGVPFGSAVASSGVFTATGYPYTSIGGSYMSYNATSIIDDVAYFNRALTQSDVNVIWGLIETSPVTEISLNTAVGNGVIIGDNGSTITERGVCWNTSITPTTANSKSTASGTIGTYSAPMSSLSPNTLYYVRAYYTNGLGTTYGAEVTFTTLNIAPYELQKDISATEGQTFIGQINVTGTLGTVTVQLGTTGTATVINAGAGVSTFTGTYSGLSGLIITRSATFNGTVDDVFYVAAPLGTTVDFTLDTLTIITAIDSSVFFKRIEDDIFNSFAFYRYLDLLFKDLDGYVTVTVRDEREDISTDRTKEFSVGNTSSGTVSPFQKKRISFLIKNQAVIIGLSNANLNETFSIAQFVLTGHQQNKKMFSPSKIISLS